MNSYDVRGVRLRGRLLTGWIDSEKREKKKERKKERERTLDAREMSVEQGLMVVSD